MVGNEPERARGEEGTSLDEQMYRCGFGTFQWVLLVACISFIVADGMELVVTNVLWNSLPTKEWGAPDFMRAVLLSASFSGFVLGAIIGGLAGDFYGRLPLIYVHSVIFIPSSIISALSQSIQILLITRFVIGVSIGLVLPTVVSLMSEFTPETFRGKAVIALPGIAYAGGQVFILLVGIFLKTAFGDCKQCEWWRWMLAAGIIPDVVGILLIFIYVPESPRFLLYQGRMDKVEDVVCTIARMNGTRENLVDGGACRPLPANDRAHDSLTMVAEMIQEPLVRIVPMAIITWVFLSVAVFAQVFLWPIRVEELGYDSTTQFWLMILVALAEIPGILCVMALMDMTQPGRGAGCGLHPLATRQRLLFALSTVSAFVILLFLIVVVLSGPGPVWEVFGNALWRITSVAPYELMYVYVAELLPTSHRNTGLSLGNATTKLVAMVLPLVLFPLLTLAPAAPYIFVSVCAALGVLLAWLCPETDLLLKDTAEQMRNARTDLWLRRGPPPELTNSGEAESLVDKKQ